MNLLTREQMEKLPTKRLLAYKRKLQSAWHYIPPEDEMDEWDLKRAREHSAVIDKVRQDLLEVLNKREHVVRPGHPEPEAPKKFHKRGKIYLVGK